MRIDKEVAFELRRQGKSYNNISQTLGMSKSTLTKWFHGVDFSEAIKSHLSKEVQRVSTERLIYLNTVRGDSLRAHYIQAEKEAEQEMHDNLNNPLFIAAISAYWGEGDKAANGQVRIINTDPKMILIFKTFLTSICHVPEDKLRGALYIYQDLDEFSCKQFWIKETGLNRFHKTMVLPSRHKSKKVQHGMCSLIVTNTYLKHKILLWVDRLPRMILNSEAKMRP